MDVVYSRDGFVELAARLRAAGARRILVISGPTRRHVDAAVAALADFDVSVFDRATVHVPIATVEAARAVAATADTIVAIGGGSAIGLGKALRLERDLRFAAVPTTYAGSEQTSMYGITRERDKQTGRDDRVRPDLVIYDVPLVRDMPIALTVQSLCNSVAHVASIASTGSTEHGPARDALHAIEDLLLAPRAIAARERAARAAAACAMAFERGKPGIQHGLAHLLGGALGLDHAALHAALLPHFLAHLRATAPAVIAALELAVDRPDLDAYIHDLLVRAGAPVALTALGATQAALDGIATDLPIAIARDALHGLRPPGRGGRIVLGGSEAVVIGPPPERARRIVVALHGRGAEAGTIARRYREIAGHDPDVCILGLRTAGDRWYAVRYGEAGAGSNPEVLAALDRVDAALASLPRDRVILAGFSQGACLALEYAARRGADLAGVIAPCAARVGQRAEWATARLDGLRVMVGAAADDKWIARADLDATATWFRDAGALVDDISGPGDRHEITARQRIHARTVIEASSSSRGRFDATRDPASRSDARAPIATASHRPPDSGGTSGDASDATRDPASRSDARAPIATSSHRPPDSGGTSGDASVATRDPVSRGDARTPIATSSHRPPDSGGTSGDAFDATRDPASRSDARTPIATSSHRPPDSGGTSGDAFDAMSAMSRTSPGPNDRREAVHVGPCGFGNTLVSESIAGAVPPHQNSPRRPPFGLYAEQISGTGFTAPRAENRRTWIYRVRPAAHRGDFAPAPHPRVTGSFDGPTPIELAGFAPLADHDGDFVDGLVTLCGAGDARHRTGYALHRYTATKSMESRAFYSADGDLLILPDRGTFTLLTELGPLVVAPGSLAVIPRGLAFSVLLHGEPIRGYVAEPCGGSFRLPERGPVGANGLADPRHFRAPAAWHEDRLAPGFAITGKLGGVLHEARRDFTPFDVAGWFGNHAPFVYDLADFSPVGNTSFDHGDPSIYCVLSAPNLDLIVFPPRWDPTANTFRPPYFHRNTIAEINGIVRDPTVRAPFAPGCVFITPPLTAHGLGGRTVEHVRSHADDAPHHITGSLWFQLESPLAPVLAPWAQPLEDWPATWPSTRSYFER